MGNRTQFRYLWNWCKKARSRDRSSRLTCMTSKILIGFAATAYSTLLLCIAYYLVDSKRVSNPVDQKCIDRFYRLFNQSRPSVEWTKAIEAAVLTFSDQQVITGLAILVSGYSQLRSGLAVYYWQLTGDLAWFSSITHLTTLTCLRYYFQERPGLKILRLICMAVNAGMLSCAVISTGYLGSGDFSVDYPAWCLFHPTLLRTATNSNYYPYREGSQWSGYYNTVYVALVLLLLSVSYGARVIQLFPSIWDKIRQNSYARLSGFARGRLLVYKNRALGNMFRTYWASVYTLTLTIYCILKAATDLYSSMLWEVCSALQIPFDDTHTDYLNHKITWLATALVWGTIRIIMDRDVDFGHQISDPVSMSGQDLRDAVLESDVWGFGQVVTVVLLLAPLFSFFETIYGKCERFWNAGCVWTTRNHTKILSPTESVIMKRKKYGRLPASAPTELISPDPVSSPGSSSSEPWTDLYECAWFRSLVRLIYLQTLGIAANVLYIFALGNGAYNMNHNIGFIVQFYLIWFGYDLAMLLLFTMTSLSLCHAQDTSVLRWTWRAKLRANWRPSKRTKLIQRIILNVSVLVLTAPSVAFGWILLYYILE